ncbi:MAG: sulfatase-like hydrolase/transferase [Bacteroidales bacterium]|nr:sulfatase-like hydrolase/transferase [Bacteroidales bacterium]
MKIKSSPYSNVVAVLLNLVLVYVLYMVTRVAFVLENWNLFSVDWDQLSMGELLAGSLRFDTSAIIYTNCLWIVLMLLPLHLKERPWWHILCHWVFVVVNSLGLCLNLVDSVYSQFTGRRTTATFFSEFSNEGNLAGIFFTELLNHWYLVLLGLALIAALWFLYVKPKASDLKPQTSNLKAYCLVNSLALLVAIPFSVFAMRGGFTRDTRPITISNANQYVHSPQQASIVLNTPFSLIRTIGKRPFKDPHYMPEEQLAAIYSPVHIPSAADTVPLLSGQRNVVVLILESFSREYIGFYNNSDLTPPTSDLQPPTSYLPPHTSYTPFLDSLLAHSLTFQHTFANGRKSIDAMPSSLTSVPFFVEPFILTPSSLNELSGLADCLGRRGYSSAFFHGAPNSSMGFQAFARSAGFQHYLGLSEYCDAPRTGGRNDFDGHWAIWDEEFLQFTANAITEQLAEPFMVGFFSASSHHPFRIPERYEQVYTGGPLPIHRTIQYSDNALRRFFQTASRQPWFQNTLFVLTADHTNQLQYPESQTSTGLFSIPIAIYDPSGQLPTGLLPGVMQQIDIMPTVLRILGYNEPYAAFGKDMFNPDETPWAVNYSNDVYQYIEGDYTLLFDGQQPTALYNYVLDPLQHSNLLADPAQAERRDRMLRRLKAIVQTYMLRMTTDHLVIRPSDLEQQQQ